MIISKITDAQGHYVSQTAPTKAIESSGFKSHRAEGRSPTSANRSEKTARLASDRDHATINRFDSQNTERNQYARQIRAFDQKMDKVSIQIKNMKKELSVIVKNYPPFPPGSEERIARLSRFNSFRKQIEQLTIPPNRDGINTVAESPASRHVGIEQGSLVIEAADDDGYILSVRRTNAQAVRLEVKLPELSEDASDAQVQTSLDDLKMASATIQAQRQKMRVDIQKINVGHETSDFFIVSENKAEANSQVMRADLAMIPNAGLTREPDLLVGFLN